MISMKLQADGLVTKIRKMKSKYPEASDKAAMVLAEAFVTTVRKNIEGSKFPLAPLSVSWTAQKAKLGLDPRILIATGDYLRSMRAVNAGKGRAKVELDARKFLRLEYGTRTMPARPHLSVALRGAKEAAKKAREVFRAVLGL